MARRIEERDDPVVPDLDVVCADVLRDASRLAGNDVGLADIIQQRRLAVVDMSHHCHHRRTRYEVFRQLLRLDHDSRRTVFFFALRFEIEFAGDDFDLIEIESLIHRHHHAKFFEAEGDDIGRAHSQHVREF